MVIEPGDSAPQGDSRARNGRDRWLWSLLVLAVAACGGYLAKEAMLPGTDLGFPLDDSWIHLQFSRNLAAGEGLAYRPGELVTGSTAPLWSALVSIAFLLPGNVVLWVKLLGVLFYLGSVDATYRLAREFDLAPGLAALAAGLFLATDAMVWSALGGMEVPLFIFLSLWGMILHARERGDEEKLPRSLVVFAAAALARPEGLLLLGLAVADRLVVLRSDQGQLRAVWPSWKPLLLGLACAATVLLPVIVFSLWVGGSPFPTTYAVKTDGVRSLLPSGFYLYRVVGVLFRPQPFMLLLAGAGVLRLLERVGSRRDRGLLPALWLLALPLVYSTFSSAERPMLVGNFGRYLFPLFPALVFLGVLGLEGLAHDLPLRMRLGRLGIPLRPVLLVLLLWPTGIAFWRGATLYAQNVQNVQDSAVRIARWIDEHLPPNAVLAVQDIGAAGYFLQNPIVDLTGIVTPKILPYIKGPLVGRGPTGLEGLLRFVEEQRADCLVVYPNSYPGLQTFNGLESIHRLQIPRNITMAGDELEVFLTPWSRLRGGTP